MPYCPECRTEYEAGVTSCADCGAGLVDALEDEEPVIALRASSPEEALVAEATLEAEGIPAFVLAGDPVLPNVGKVDDSPDLDVYVPADLADEAAAVLTSPPPSEDELAAEAEKPLP